MTTADTKLHYRPKWFRQMLEMTVNQLWDAAEADIRRMNAGSMVEPEGYERAEYWRNVAEQLTQLGRQMEGASRYIRDEMREWEKRVLAHANVEPRW